MQGRFAEEHSIGFLRDDLKRVRWLYREEKLMVRWRKREQALAQTRASGAGRWPTMAVAKPKTRSLLDGLFDRLVDNRRLQCLTVVDDSTHETVVIPRIGRRQELRAHPFWTE